MIVKWNRLLVALLLLVAFSVPASARVEWHVERNLPLPEAPLDISVTADGKRVFVLLESGEVRIYSNEGALEESLGVVGRADRLAVSPSGDRLYLSSRRDGHMQVAALDTIHSFDITGSPLLGPAEAPVEVVVFSDFQ